MKKRDKTGFRYLRHRNLGRKTKDFFVFDVETGVMDDDGNIEYKLSARPEHFIFGVIYGIYNGKESYRVFHSLASLQSELQQKKYRNRIVYAHNAEYDLSCLYGNIYKMDRRACFNGKFVSATNGNCYFADSLNVLPTSIEKLGVLLGLPKLSLGENLRSHYSRIKEDIKYCVRDCEIAFKSLTKVFANAEPSYTIGSLSLKIFRKDYLKQTIKVNGYLSDQFFDAVYGGRTECIKIGQCQARVMDINSAYPHAMRILKFPDPASLREFSGGSAYRIVEREGIEGMIHAKVTIHPDTYIPPLPWRHEGKLLFPVGTFSGAWCLNEFRHALQFGCLTDFTIERVIAAPAIESPFTEFIEENYRARSATNNEFEKYYYKLFMNNLYGKLIQREQDNYIFCDTEHEAVVEYHNKQLRHAEIISVHGGYFLRYTEGKKHSHTIAPFGGYITAHVRTMLHEKMNRYYHNVVYADTDSVAAEAQIKENSKELGGWKKEDKWITNIRALKDYEFYNIESDETGQMLKGVRKNAKQLTPQADRFEYQRMIRTRESFARTDNLPPGTFINQMKFIAGTYKKRVVMRGGETRPYIIKNGNLK